MCRLYQIKVCYKFRLNTYPVYIHVVDSKHGSYTYKFSVGYLGLTICLGMIRWNNLYVWNYSAPTPSTVVNWRNVNPITYKHSGDPKTRENISFKGLDDSLDIILWGSHNFHPLGHVIHNHQDVLIPIRWC